MQIFVVDDKPHPGDDDSTRDIVNVSADPQQFSAYKEWRGFCLAWEIKQRLANQGRSDIEVLFCPDVGTVLDQNLISEDCGLLLLHGRNYFWYGLARKADINQDDSVEIPTVVFSGGGHASIEDAGNAPQAGAICFVRWAYLGPESLRLDVLLASLVAGDLAPPGTLQRIFNSTLHTGDVVFEHLAALDVLCQGYLLITGLQNDAAAAENPLIEAVQGLAEPEQSRLTQAARAQPQETIWGSQPEVTGPLKWFDCIVDPISTTIASNQEFWLRLLRPDATVLSRLEGTVPQSEGSGSPVCHALRYISRQPWGSDAQTVFGHAVRSIAKLVAALLKAANRPFDFPAALSEGPNEPAEVESWDQIIMNAHLGFQLIALVFL